MLAATAELRRIGRLDHCVIAIAPYPESCPARAILDREPLRRAIPGLELRPNPSVARRQERRSDRNRRSARQISGCQKSPATLPQRSGAAANTTRSAVPADQAAGQEIPRRASVSGCAAVRIRRVQPAEPHGSAVRKRDLEALVHTRGQGPAGRRAAGRKPGNGADDRRENDQPPEAGEAAGPSAGERARSAISC